MTGMDAADWWSTQLTLAERSAIEAAFQPMGGISGPNLARSRNPSTIGNLLGYLKKDTLRGVGYKLIERADSLVSESASVVSVHFYFASRGDYFYRWRAIDDFALEAAVESFQRQIAMAHKTLAAFKAEKNWGFIPAHAGYRQLRIIEEKRGNLVEARALCEQAKAEGWADDWDKQITRIDKKLSALAAKG